MYERTVLVLNISTNVLLEKHKTCMFLSKKVYLNTFNQMLILLRPSYNNHSDNVITFKINTPNKLVHKYVNSALYYDICDCVVFLWCYGKFVCHDQLPLFLVFRCVWCLCVYLSF